MTNETEAVEAVVGKTVEMGFDDALARTEQALADEGFGILTRIDVKATMKQKLDVEFPPYQILGACRPPLAHEALTRVPEVGVMMPCSVVVRYVDDGRTRIDVMNAELMGAMFPQADLTDIAKEAADRMNRAIAAI